MNCLSRNKNAVCTHRRRDLLKHSSGELKLNHYTAIYKNKHVWFVLTLIPALHNLHGTGDGCEQWGLSLHLAQPRLSRDVISEAAWDHQVLCLWAVFASPSIRHTGALTRGGFLAAGMEFTLAGVFCLAYSLLRTVWLSYQYFKNQETACEQIHDFWLVLKNQKGRLFWAHILRQQTATPDTGAPFGRGKYWALGYRLTSPFCAPVLEAWCRHLVPGLAQHCFLTLPVSLLPITGIRVWSWGHTHGTTPAGQGAGGHSHGLKHEVPRDYPVAAFCVIPGNNQLLHYFLKT